VSVYIDVNGQWVSGDRNAKINWEFIQGDYVGTKGMKTWRIKKEEEALFTERNDRAEWGTFYFSAPSVRFDRTRHTQWFADFLGR